MLDITFRLLVSEYTNWQNFMELFVIAIFPTGFQVV